MKRARKLAWRIALYAVEAVGLIAAGGAIAVGLLYWRLSQGPISLDFMRDELEEALADALRGDVVSIGQAQASWRGGERLVGIVLTDVVVAERGGDVLARAPRLGADLSFSALLRADIAFSRLVAEGGEASIVRTEAGRIGAGLGSPDRVAARAQEAPAGGRRGLGFLRDALEAEGSVARELRELRLEGAVLYVRDAVTGIDWRADDATLRVTRDGGGVRAEAGGVIETGSRDTVLRVTVRAPPSMRRALVEAQLTGAVPSRLFPETGVLAPLSRIDLAMNIAASAAMDETEGLLASDLDLAVSAGRVRFFDRDVEVRGARAHLSFDPINDVLTIDETDVNADLFSGRLRGRLEGAQDWLFGDGAGPYRIELAGQELRADGRPAFAGVLDAHAIELIGEIRPSDRSIELQALNVRARDVAGAFTGRASLDRVSDGRLLPSVRLVGPVAGEAGVQDVLDFWPVELADGARDWVAAAVHAGRAHDVHLDIDLAAEALVEQRLDDDKLALSFAFDGAEVAFLSTMSPVTEARGTGVLRGNSFSIDLETAEMAGLVYESGFVEIPVLNPKGALARFGGVAKGTTSDVLAFIDEPPLEFPSSYGVAPTSIGGAGTVDFEITRPMLVDVPAEDIGFTVAGQFADVSAPTMMPGLDVQGADVAVTADRAGLVATGRGRLGPAPADIEWRESFADGEGQSTRFHVVTTLDAAAFDAFGAPVRRVFTGSAAVTLDAQGRGLDISRAEIDADLTAASLTLPGAAWSKPAGEPADARLVVTRGEDGALSISDARLAAPGADIAGALSLAADGRLESLDLERLAIEDFVDANGRVWRGDDGGLVVRAAGAYADVSGVVEELARGGGGGVGAPLDLDVRFDRATARAGAVLEDVAVQIEHDGTRTRRLEFTATGEGGPITARVEPTSDRAAPRRFTLDAADAGEALYVLFGVNSVRGGTLTARADLPALEAPEEAVTSATVEARDFVLAGAPPLAQILTIGSLEGLANTLAGEGIRFSRLDAPLTIADGRLTLNEAQAAGRALGVTVNGVIDLEARTFDLEGVLVPAYGVNSVLGAVPVIGDIFVSRRGEGVFGLTYSIDGPFEQTRVFVNPLSALAPGFLRRLFEPVTVEPGAAAPAEADRAGAEDG